MIKEWFSALLILLLFIDIYLSASVYVDAKKLRKPALNVPAAMWGLISFIFPLIGFFIYWLMNHSTLTKVNRN